MTPMQRQALEQYAYVGQTWMHVEVAAALAELDRLKAENRYLLAGIERLTRDSDQFAAGQESEREAMRKMAREGAYPHEGESRNEWEVGWDDAMEYVEVWLQQRGVATPTPLDAVLSRLEALEKACEPILAWWERPGEEVAMFDDSVAILEGVSAGQFRALARAVRRDTGGGVG